MVRIVMVHGRDKPFEIKDTVEREWAEALHYGLQRLNPPFDLKTPPVLAWYGDVWRPDNQAAPSTRGAERGDTAVGDSPATGLQVGLVQEALGARGETVQAQAADTVGGERGTFDTLAGLVGKLEPYLSDALSKRIIQTFLYDINDYFTKPDIRRVVMKRVADTIRSTNDKVLLLAHSMGTIVSYDVLMNRDNLLVDKGADPSDYPVVGFVSFGCPLGFSSVRRNVGDAQGNTQFPPNLPYWANIYNKEDFVAAIREIAAYYPSGDSRQVQDKDEGQGIEPGPFNLITGHDPKVYLSSMALVQSILPILAPAMSPPPPPPPTTPRGSEAELGDTRGAFPDSDSEYSYEAAPDGAGYGYAGSDDVAGGAPMDLGGYDGEGGSSPSPQGGGGSRGAPPYSRNLEAGGIVPGGVVPVAGGGGPAEPPAESSAPTDVPVAPVTPTERTMERTASADFPPTVKPGSKNLLTYTIAGQQLGAYFARFSVQVPADLTELNLVVSVLTSDFAVFDADTGDNSNYQRITLHPQNDNEQVGGQFQLVARDTAEPVKTKIYLRFASKGLPVAQIEIPTVIAPDAGTAAAGRSAPLQATIMYDPQVPTAPEPDLIIDVTKREDSEIYDIRVSRDEAYYGLDLGSFPTTNNAWSYAQSVLNQFKDAQKLQPPAARQARVDGLGKSLWNNLSDLFRNFYWDEMHGNDLSIAIYSDEPYIPWELIKPFKAGADDVPMFGIQFSMARWKQGRKFPSPLVVSDFVVIAPDYPVNALPNTKLEAAALQRDYNAQVITGAYADVAGLLDTGEAQIVHFAGHGNFDPSTSSGEIALVDQPLIPSDVLDRHLGKTYHPLVFLNACEVGEQGWALTQIGGWAEAFCDGEFSAFLGPYWNVDDQVAMKAALLFYGLLKGGSTIGQAMQKVRGHFTGDEDPQLRYSPTWLAYTLHCQPNVTVQFKT